MFLRFVYVGVFLLAPGTFFMHLGCFCCIVFVVEMGKTIGQSITRKDWGMFSFGRVLLPAFRGGHIFETNGHQTYTSSNWVFEYRRH